MGRNNICFEICQFFAWKTRFFDVFNGGPPKTWFFYTFNFLHEKRIFLMYLRAPPQRKTWFFYNFYLIFTFNLILLFKFFCFFFQALLHAAIAFKVNSSHWDIILSSKKLLKCLKFLSLKIFSNVDINFPKLSESNFW